MDKFKSLFLVNVQTYILDQSHYMFVKLSCESACENIDSVSARSTVRIFSANFPIEQGVIVAAIVITLLIFTRF